jgi:16S rRNA (cytosine1402-N4)-methyltransferase
MNRRPRRRSIDSSASAPPRGPSGGGRHVPVLLTEVVAALAPPRDVDDDALFVDGTFGAGGYSAALLATVSGCRVVGIDRDPDAVRRGAALAAQHAGRLTLIEGRFGDMARLVDETGAGPVVGVALDLGASSMQLDEAERGFSFRLDGPLDMRMSSSTGGRDGDSNGGGESAADLVARLSESELAEIIRNFGEERFARRVARAIVAHRQHSPIRRTAELADIVRGAIPTREPGLDPATRTFQALRIAVNDELGELDRGLAGAERLLMPGGRLAVVAFHSLEDARVKNFLRQRSVGGIAGAAATGTAASRHAPPPQPGPPPSFRLLARRPIRPGVDEIARNPRARSARLRTAERTAAPPWPVAGAAAVASARLRSGPTAGGLPR